MVKQVQMFEASDGSAHKSELDAHKHELRQILRGLGELNEASARLAAEQIVARDDLRDTLIASLRTINQLTPREDDAA